MAEFWRDLRYGLRSFGSKPGLAVVVTLTLGLGIGGTTAIFSFVNGVLLRPLPYPEPDRLVRLCEVGPQADTDWCGVSPANLADWVRSSRTFGAMGLARNWRFGWQGAAHRERVEGGIATPGLFQVFQVRPSLGRLFQEGEAEAGREHVAVVSDEFWRARLGADPGAVGRQLDLDGEPYQLVGVLPAAFVVPELRPVEVWIPLWPATPERADYRWWRGFSSFGRLAPAATLPQARTEMQGIRAALEQAYPKTNAGWGLAVEPLQPWLARGARGALLAFQGAVFCLLLIACANVSNLLLARATEREREFAVRCALGAGRLRLLRQVLAETLIFAVSGGALGLLLAIAIVDLVRGLAPASFPRLDAVQVSAGPFAFTAVVALLASLAAGFAPALQAFRIDLDAALQGGRSNASRREGVRMRSVLGVVQIALALVLVCGAGLLARSFLRLLDWRPGFDYHEVVTVQVFNSPAKYPDAGTVADLYTRAVEQLRGLPTVVSAAAASAGPLFGGDGAQECYVEGRPIPPDGRKPQVLWYDVGPGYFETIGVPLVEGRGFSERDGPSAPRVAIVNQTMARRLWPGESPLGTHVFLVGNQASVEIVGVIADTQPLRSDQTPQPEIYWPYMQAPRYAIHFVVRGNHSAAGLAPAIRARLLALDPDMDIGRFASLEEHLAGELVAPRFTLGLVGLFAALALLIAGVGIYGVVAFSVAARTREIGLRMALGARPGDVLRWVLGGGVRLAAWGLAIGLAGVVALTRLLRGLLVSVSPTDPLTLAATATLLALVVLAASAVPARRAARVAPIDALRCP